MDEYDIQLRIPQGCLKGQKVLSEVTGQIYYAFRGIPYAKPPVVSLRFRPPEPPDPWEGVLDAQKERNKCSQYYSPMKKYLGDEDCLYLNLYTKTWPPKDLLPVMVFIHGGGYSNGSGSYSLYGPDFLVMEEIVLVTFNYRLGVLGFLNVEGSDATSSNGLRDQTAALMWIKNNIYCFGGDPDNVTLFGSSTGSSSVHYHLLSPFSKGLFHRAIMHSGTALIKDLYTAKKVYMQRAIRLGIALGTNLSNPQELIDFLRTVPVKDLVLAAEMKTLTDEESQHAPIMPFLPSLEGPEECSFVPGHPEGLMKYGRFHDVPVIIGIASADGKIALQPVFHFGSVKEVNQDFGRALNWNWKYYLKERKFKQFKNIIRKFYLNNRSISEENITNYVNFQTDLIFKYPLYKTVQYMLKYNKSPIYIYQFCNKEPPDYALPGLNTEISHLPGAGHEADLIYLFHSQITPPSFTSDPSVQKTTRNIVKLWTNFAKYGNPSEDLDIKWPSVEKNSAFPYINISDELAVQQNFVDKRIQFLDVLIERMNIMPSKI